MYHWPFFIVDGAGEKKNPQQEVAEAGQLVGCCPGHERKRYSNITIDHGQRVSSDPGP